jgi:tetratricopeptide (TPR) repeat protein
MSDSPFPRVAALSIGLVGASALVAYAALGLSLARPDSAALRGLPEASQQQARQLYWGVGLMPWSSAADMKLGEFFLANDRPAAAAVWLTRATRWETGLWRGWYYLGLADRALHRYADAETAFRKVLALNSDYVAARVQLACLPLDQGRPADAQLTLAALVRTGADQTRLAQAIGLAMLRQENYQGARRSFEQALSRFSAYGDAHAGLAAALRGLGETQQAMREERLAHNQRGIVPPPTDDPLSETMDQEFPTARSLFQQAARNRDVRTAVETFQKAVALDPGMTNAWENLIALYGQAKRPLDAERAWNRLAKIDPKNVRGRYNLGVALGQSGQRAKSAVYLNQVIELDPSYNDAHRMLGQLAQLDGNLPEAEKEFRTAFTNEPGMSDAHTDLAMLFLKSGHTKEAVAEFLRALLPPCEQPERTLLRELTMLRDQPIEQSFEDAVKAQAAANNQPALITMINNRKKPVAPSVAGLPGLMSK